MNELFALYNETASQCILPSFADLINCGRLFWPMACYIPQTNSLQSSLHYKHTIQERHLWYMLKCNYLSLRDCCDYMHLHAIIVNSSRHCHILYNYISNTWSWSKGARILLPSNIWSCIKIALQKMYFKIYLSASVIFHINFHFVLGGVKARALIY